MGDLRAIDQPEADQPGGPWFRHVQGLTSWALKIVVRRDVYGKYIPPNRRTDPKRIAYAEKAEPTEEVLKAHFTGQAVIGFFTTDDQGFCRQAGIDIDRHGDDGSAQANEQAAVTIYDRGAKLGLAVLLEATNGRGGFKVRLIFSELVPARWVRRLLRSMTQDWRELGLVREPEVFPKQDAPRPGGKGNFDRLPGRHHTLDYWSQIWGGDQWFAGEAAARMILRTMGSPAWVIPREFRTEAAESSLPSPRKRPHGARRSERLVRLLTSALESLPPGYPGNYEQWIELGMSLFDLGDQGLILWEFASRKCSKYRVGSCGEKWATFQPNGGRTYRTILYLAKKNGWKFAATSVSATPLKSTGADLSSLATSVIENRTHPAGTQPTHAGSSDGDQAPGGHTPPPTPPGNRTPPSQPGGQGSNLPIIIWNGRPMHPVTDEALTALTIYNRDPKHFRLGNTLVRVREGGGSSSIEPHSEESFRGVLDRAALWAMDQNSQGGKGKQVITPPPKHIVRDVLSLPDWPSAAFPPLDVVVRCPTFAADGSLIDQPGYHAASRSYYSPPPELVVPPVPAHIDDATLKRAGGLLDELVCDFPFKTPGDKANATAVVLTSLARNLISGPTPFLLIEAPVMGTGKTKLAEALLIPSLGRPSTTAQPGDDDEWRKAITASLAESPQAIWYDNLAGSLKSQKLEQVLTSDFWTDRLLGETKTICLPNRCVWIGTANNLQILGDLHRRIVWIRLVSLMERPEDRDPSQFKHQLPDWALANRGDLIWAGLVLIRAWIERGCPQGSQSMASFESWAKVIGGILQVAGIPGFLEAQRERRIQSDDLASQYGPFLESVNEKLGSVPFGVKDLKWVVDPDDANYDPEMLQGVLTKETKGERAKQLGWRLSQNVDRVYGRYQLVGDGRDSRSKCPLYKVVKLDEPRRPAEVVQLINWGEQSSVTPIVLSREAAERSTAFWSRLDASGLRGMDLIGDEAQLFEACHVFLLSCDDYRLITDRALLRLLGSHGKFPNLLPSADWSGRQNDFYHHHQFMNRVLEGELEFNFHDRLEFDGRTLYRYSVQHSWDLAEQGEEETPPAAEWLPDYDRATYQAKYSEATYYSEFVDLCRRWWLFGAEVMSTSQVLWVIQEFNLLPDLGEVYPELPQERELAKILASIEGFEFDGFFIEATQKITNLARCSSGEPDYFWTLKLVDGFNPPAQLADKGDPVIRRQWQKEFQWTQYAMDWLLTPRS